MRTPAVKKAHKVKRPSPPFESYADSLVKAALAEDVGRGDITTKAIISPDESGEGVFLAKEDFVLAGLFMAEKVFKSIDEKAVFRAYLDDGEHVKKGRVFATVRGRLDALLTGERVALNFVQRMSGIATRTDMFVKKIKAAGAKILDTRKTTPCLRMLEKYAVKAGGGTNHRFGLFDRVLIKDNHIAAAGSVREAIERVERAYHGKIPVEVEVTNLKELKEALAAGADMIMLDNMDTVRIKRALKIIGKRALVEASGGVTFDNVLEVAKTGVDFISVGALTHSARAVDISMEIVKYAGKRRRSR